MNREPEVVTAFVSLTDSLLGEFDILDLLTDLTEVCARLLDVAAAGLLLADAGGQLHILATTSERTRELELFQLQRDEGPCLDCYHSGEPITVADLRTETQRWPRFVPAAATAGFFSVHAVPMRAQSSVLGTLGLFGSGTGTLNVDDLNLAQALAHVATVAILQDHSTTPVDAVFARLRNLLDSRGVLEQAKGVLYERFGISMHDAFARLRGYAREHHEPLTHIARTVVTDAAADSALLNALAPAPPS
jgi:transcriptional regulator with GAF, ATPase, and Fis domain